VNGVSATRRGEPLVVTGSDDCTAMVWDLRTRHPSKTLTHEYQVTSVCFSEDSSQVYTGSIDHNVYVSRVPRNAVVY
jgi:Prp8 binding protein